MDIELSNLTFTDQDDVVPASGGGQIVNTGIVNTLAGNDRITGSGARFKYSFLNGGVLNTGDGDDILTGSRNVNEDPDLGGAGFRTYGGEFSAATFTGIRRYGGIIETGNGNDKITGIAQRGAGIAVTFGGTINTGNDNDTITGTATNTGIRLDKGGTVDTGNGNDIITGTGFFGFENSSTFNTGDGNDIITGTDTTGGGYGIYNNIETVVSQYSTNNITIDTGDGDDIITGIGGIGIYNDATINTGNSADSIISQGSFINKGNVFLEDGNDSIIADANLPDRALENFNFIGTGDGNDTIITTGVIYNEGIIETGNGDDSIIVNGTGTGYGIYNNGGAINMGDGNDSIIANEGFESGSNSSGAWFLGEGNDYIKGYGSGDFYGGNGNDTLELTPGTYTVGIWGEGGESPIFTKGNQLMITSEFEKLKAGNTLYDFTSLTAGQIITVA
jgi:hypothetical protein